MTAPPTRRFSRRIARLLTTPLLTAGLAVGLAAPLTGCGTGRASIVAESELQWTGVAVDQSGRLFLNFPRWSDRYENAVIVLLTGRALPYPSPSWNEWSPGDSWRTKFVSVQSVHVDRQDRLWILDTGRVNRAEGRQAVVYEFDPKTETPARVIPLSFDVAPEGSYINDIRLTPDGRHAFISDSGLGAIIHLDTRTGVARRLLADHSSTKGSPDKTPVINGKPWVIAETGEPNVVHCDGIAVSPDGQWVYYQSISNDTLYRVPVAALISPSGNPAGSVEVVGKAPVTDGMIFDDQGNLYFSALEKNAVIYRTPDGEFRTLVRDHRLDWPDSFAIDRRTNTLYFTTAQIHETPRYRKDGKWPRDPFRVWSIPLPE